MGHLIQFKKISKSNFILYAHNDSFGHVTTNIQANVLLSDLRCLYRPFYFNNVSLSEAVAI